MFRLESNRLKREFKIADGKLYASQIVNKYSGMSFVPDGNGSEFVVHFADGEAFSSKSLTVANAGFDGDRLVFSFEEYAGLQISLEYWVHKDKNTVCKQIIINQSDDRAVDCIQLESVGIINSKTNFSVESVEGSEIPPFQAALGQPVYVDSLFFGCEFPATENRIIHSRACVRYYIGHSLGKNFVCPVTVMGGGRDNTLVGMKKAFFEYIESISAPTDLRFQYNSWYDHMRDIDEEKILYSFKEVHDKLEEYGAPKLESYVVDDGWVDMKAPFWDYNKKFKDGMGRVVSECARLGSGFGMWLGPRGGYNGEYHYAKRLQKHGNGYVNKQGREICVASSDYINKLQAFFIEQTKTYNLNYWKLDGFATKPCQNKKHDHMTGGKEDMYFVTDLWQKWIALYENLRKVKPDLWINMTCYVNVSPWWLQWVNSLWLQNSTDIGFADNQEKQAQVDAEITFRDGRYYDCVCRRALQIPLKYLYNHEPIYGNTAKVSYTDEEFEKYIYWCMVRGQALNELHLSPNMMNAQKWLSLSNAMNCQKDNYYILQNASFIGGDPLDNNIYGYISWAENGDGIIALRNPNNEETSLTLTLNKLMGTPECLKDAKRYNIYCKTLRETDETYDYNSKMDLTMRPYEVMIFKIGRNN